MSVAPPASSAALTSLEPPRELRHLAHPKRAFAAACRRLVARGVVGPELVGEGRARYWTCPADVWVEQTRRKAPPMLRVVPSIEDAAEAAIAAAGLRTTRSASR